MKIRFYAERRKDAEGKLITVERPVFMAVSFHGKRMMISTGQKVSLQWWDPVTQQVMEGQENAFMVNERLRTLRDAALEAYRVAGMVTGGPDPVVFKREFERLKPAHGGGFFDLYYKFMEAGSSRWSTNSYRKVRSFYNQLRAFGVETGYPFSFRTIDEAFLFRLRDFFRGKGLSDATILKQVNTLVWFLNWAREKGYNRYDDYRKFYKLLKPSIRPSEKFPVYLEWQELIRLRDHVISRPVMDRARDLYCLMCFTGLRFGELIRLQKSDLAAGGITVRYRGDKTRMVPLNEHAAKLVSKYANRYYRDNAALPRISMVTMNKYIRLLGRELHFNRKVAVSGIQEEKALWEVLTAGTGVQTFIMNAIMLDIPAEMIAEFTGVRNDLRVRLIRQQLAKEQMNKFSRL